MQRKKFLSTLVLAILVIALLPVAALGQGPIPPVEEPVQLDDGTWAQPSPISPLRAPDLPGSITALSASNSIATLFASNNQFAGNMFDFTVIGPSAVTINGFDVNIYPAGAAALIEVYYRLDSYVGDESSPTGWMSMGTDTVVAQGVDTPTPVNIGGVTIPAGATYGLYVLVVDYPAATMRYTNGNNTYANADVRLDLGVGKGDPPFTGSTFYGRTWNGTIYYTTNTPPDCTNAAPSQGTIWPPNHKWVSIDVLGVTDPDGDEVTITIDSIYQDEPVDTNGDGSFTPDGDGVGTSTASVRAERAGGEDGRVYHIGFTASDPLGATCSGEVLVGVPHDKQDTPVDGGALYDSTALAP